LPSYHVQLRALSALMCKMCFCAICAYVRSKIFAFNLIMKRCSKVFSMLYRSLFFGVFGKISFLQGVKCMEILTSAGIDQAASFLTVANGAESLE